MNFRYKNGIFIYEIYFCILSGGVYHIKLKKLDINT
jgi:hypothetical protein